MKVLLIILGVLCVIDAVVVLACIKVGADAEYVREKDKSRK